MRYVAHWYRYIHCNPCPPTQRDVVRHRSPFITPLAATATSKQYNLRVSILCLLNKNKCTQRQTSKLHVPLTLYRKMQLFFFLRNSIGAPNPHKYGWGVEGRVPTSKAQVLQAPVGVKGGGVPAYVNLVFKIRKFETSLAKLKKLDSKNPNNSNLIDNNSRIVRGN